MTALLWFLATCAAVVALAYAVWRWLRPASNDSAWVRRPFDEGAEE